MNQQLISDRFPFLPIIIAIDSVRLRTEALVDTGFDGHVILPRSALPDDISPPDSFVRWGLADGSVVQSPVYEGTIRIDGTGDPISGSVSVLGREVLIGRAFLDNFRITLDHGRRVLVEP